ncbi:transcriptional regulator NrdR family protein [Microbacterium sp. BE35]|nr:transcriptional regulator NrdR family protein [Microbacterium sp. BE35]
MKHHIRGELTGQRMVHSSQLASEVLSALRQVDDVAYLRWATVTNNIRIGRPFAVEVADLLYAPWPRTH